MKIKRGSKTKQDIKATGEHVYTQTHTHIHRTLVYHLDYMLQLERLKNVISLNL